MDTFEAQYDAVRSWNALNPCSCDSPSWEVRSNTRVFSGAPLWCASPAQMMCRACGGRVLARCNTTRASQCPPCAQRYRVRVRRVAESGMVDLPAGSALFLTVTAPGTKVCKGVPKRMKLVEQRDRVRRRVLRWVADDRCTCEARGRRDRRHDSSCRWSVACTCKGPQDAQNGQHFAWCAWQTCYCTTADTAVTTWDRAADWNTAQPKQINRFITEMRRLYGSDLQYYKATEVQWRKRASGHAVLHQHIILRREDGQSWSVTAAWFERLRAMAVTYGYGHILDVQIVEAPEGDKDALALYATKLAGYTAKTISEASDLRQMVPWRSKDGQVAPRGGYRTWTASRQWGARMAEIKAAYVARALHAARLRAAALDYSTGSYGSESSGTDGWTLTVRWSRRSDGLFLVFALMDEDSGEQMSVFEVLVSGSPASTVVTASLCENI
jgi:hypothetical protein